MKLKLYKVPKIVNIVSLWDLGRKVEIKGDSGKTSKRFNADIIKEAKKCLLVFESGKIIATGFTSIPLARTFIKENFLTEKTKFVKIVNMTAVGSINASIDVIKFTQSNQNVSYEPEIYPALYWRDGKVCVTYYPKGSYIITGVKNRKQAKEVFMKFFFQL